jgi:hypothetical protein
MLSLSQIRVFDVERRKQAAAGKKNARDSRRKPKLGEKYLMEETRV